MLRGNRNGDMYTATFKFYLRRLLNLIVEIKSITLLTVETGHPGHWHTRIEPSLFERLSSSWLVAQKSESLYNYILCSSLASYLKQPLVVNAWSGQTAVYFKTRPAYVPGSSNWTRPRAMPGTSLIILHIMKFTHTCAYTYKSIY